MIYALCFFAGCFCGAVAMAFMAGASRLKKEYDDNMARIIMEGANGNGRAMQADFVDVGYRCSNAFCNPGTALLHAEYKRGIGESNASAEK